LHVALSLGNAPKEAQIPAFKKFFLAPGIRRFVRVAGFTDKDQAN
jgi:hypothetical protein